MESGNTTSQSCGGGGVSHPTQDAATFCSQGPPPAADARTVAHGNKKGAVFPRSQPPAGHPPRAGRPERDRAAGGAGSPPSGTLGWRARPARPSTAARGRGGVQLHPPAGPGQGHRLRLSFSEPPGGGGGILGSPDHRKKSQRGAGDHQGRGGPRPLGHGEGEPVGLSQRN